MTSADEKTVYPDLNVPGTQARAIRGEQEVLDKVTIPAGLPVEESEKLVSEMTAKHGIVHVNDTGDAAGKELLARKGDEALVNYAEASKHTRARMLVNQLKRQRTVGGVFSRIFAKRDVRVCAHISIRRRRCCNEICCGKSTFF